MNFRSKLLTFSLCALLCGVAACGKSDGIGASSGGASLPGSGGNNSGGGSSGSAPAVISENDKPLDVMTRAMRAQLDAKSYRAHVTATRADEAPTKMIIEYVAPDRYRMVSDAQVGGKSVSQEIIIVGNNSYFKAPNGQWIRAPVDASEIIKGFRDPKTLDELAKTADVKFVGADTIDGAPMLVYQYTQNNPMGMKLKSVSKTWLSAADGLPRKTESEGEVQGKKSKTLVTISDYNADIKIESPVK